MGAFKRLPGALAIVALLLNLTACQAPEGEGDAGPDPRMQAKVKENIKPVGQVNVGQVVASAADAGGAAAARSGEQVYNAACMACHGTGVAGAPKVGDKDAWRPRAGKGMNTLLDHAVNGFNAMPPKGTCADCSKDELKGAVEYMLSQTGL